MTKPLLSSLLRLPRAVIRSSAGLFYAQWIHRYLLYLAACLLIGVWAFVALEIYGWLTWRVTSISFRGSYILHTMMNFGLCLYVTDEWLARLTGRWGRFANRTLGKQALIWGMSFVTAFFIQRTVVFEETKYYALDIYHYYEEYPQMRPHSLDHFLFCLPFFIATILVLWLVIFGRQHGLEKERKALLSLKQALIAKEEALRDTVLNAQSEKDDVEAPSLCFQSGSSQIILDQDSISHVTVEDHYCRIHTSEKDEARSYFVKSSLANLLEDLPDTHFIRIHRSHAVNVQAIRQIDKKNRASKVYLKSDTVLPVSRYRLNEVMARVRESLELQANPPE